MIPVELIFIMQGHRFESEWEFSNFRNPSTYLPRGLDPRESIQYNALAEKVLAKHLETSLPKSLEATLADAQHQDDENVSQKKHISITVRVPREFKGDEGETRTAWEKIHPTPPAKEPDIEGTMYYGQIPFAVSLPNGSLKLTVCPGNPISKLREYFSVLATTHAVKAARPQVVFAA